MSGERGCGRRVEGGIYAVCPTGPDGVPIEEFLYDPAHPVNPEWGLTPRGIKAIEINGVTHMMDWVGESNYPNLYDFIMEGKRMGISRRMPKSFPFERLTRDSKMLLAHPRARVANHPDFWGVLRERGMGAGNLAHLWAEEFCPKRDRQHVGQMCLGIGKHLVEGGEEVAEGTGVVRRVIGSSTYMAYSAPAGFKPDYEPGLFAWFPIHHIEVVRSLDGSHTDSTDRAAKGGLNVEEVDE